MDKLDLYYIDLKYIHNLSNADVITNRANKVFDLVVNNPEKSKNLVNRSSIFIRLEQELKRYIR